MGVFDYQMVEVAAKELYIRALKILPPDVRQALKTALARETNPAAKETLRLILENVDIADREDTIICQDTGLPFYMVKVGSKFPVDGARVAAALKEGVRKATVEYPLRPSSVHPVTRENPQTNGGEGLPIIHWDFVPENDFLEILMAPKAASENRSAMKMFSVAEGVAALKRFVIDTVVQSGAHACPPGVIGVGIGGTADLVTKLAQEAVGRPVGSHNHDSFFAKMEDELLEALNSLGIGPMALGGDVTALAVHIEWAYTQLYLNPVAVTIQCWPVRRARARINADGKVEYGF